jgi:hypothetical protein
MGTCKAGRRKVGREKEKDDEKSSREKAHLGVSVLRDGIPGVLVSRLLDDDVGLVMSGKGSMSRQMSALDSRRRKRGESVPLGRAIGTETDIRPQVVNTEGCEGAATA